MSSTGIGLGLGLGVFIPDIEPVHAANDRSISTFHGPRSIATRGRLITFPPSSLPATRYNRDPTANPLSVSNPVNSPHLDLSLANISPAQHLRQIKKRAIAAQGLGGEPSDGIGSGTGSRDLPGGGHVTVPASPTIASNNSPTLGSSSPAMSSPTPDTPSLVGPGIALGVVLGLFLLGMTTWAGLIYRRRSQRKRLGNKDEEAGEASVSKFSQETFTASDIREKGFKPRRDSDILSFPIRPGSTKFGSSPKAFALSFDTRTDRRVSFVDDTTPMSADSIMNLHQQLYAPPPGRHRSTSIGAGRRRSDDRTSMRVSIASTLENIQEEESSLSISSSDPSIRRGSIVSISSSSSDNSSAYTTASARSSISDLTTLSTISALSSAFPETPRGPTSTSPSTSTPLKQTRRARSHTIAHAHIKLVDQKRTTAVGRTMSLQPSKDDMTALQALANEERLKAFEQFRNIGQCQDPTSNKHTSSVGDPVSNGEIETDGSATQQQDSPPAYSDPPSSASPPSLPAIRPENGMKKVLFQLESTSTPIPDQDVRYSIPLPRSNSFPTKLLARRRSLSSVQNSPVRQSEVLTGGHLRRALRAFRGIDEEPLPSTIENLHDEYQIRVDDGYHVDQIKSHDAYRLEQTRIDNGSHFNDKRHSEDSIWEDNAAFDSYYLGLLGELDDDWRSEGEMDDELDEFPLPSGHLPHIRVTAH
ncbi:hypothetical protein BCR39DRAFT_591300 [Naematelia encephala]|uniref:Uncharacterized protein n=1 Tax=Naematelia encephala TaxID=71784 RepID=A0A1Y2AIV1_9TREE|nr:hypothetical protein BCR39DRAFT_591300 [Naematelia encephala]